MNYQDYVKGKETIMGQEAYCIMCDRKYDEDAPVVRNKCPNCRDGFGPDSAKYSIEELHIREGRWQAFMDVVIRETAKGAQNGLEYAYKDTLDVLDRLGLKEGKVIIKKHLTELQEKSNG